MSIASKEVWRPIQGYPYYEVSSLGRVRSLDREVKHPRGGLKRIAGRVLRQGTLRGGYKHVMLNDRKTYLVHRLVARSFPEVCGEWFDHCEIDHKNTIRDDNRAENLKVCTRHENHMNPITRERNRVANAQKRLGKAPWNKGRKLPEQSGENHWRTRPVYQFKDGELINEYGSVVEASGQTGILKTAIYNNLSKRSSVAGGFVWSYERRDFVN